jgi:MYXO-CTERM domain-containing protein
MRALPLVLTGCIFVGSEQPQPRPDLLLETDTWWSPGGTQWESVHDDSAPDRLTASEVRYDDVVITEVLLDPACPDGAYLELFNAAGQAIRTSNLELVWSGLQVSALSDADGSLLEPGGYRAVVQSGSDCQISPTSAAFPASPADAVEVRFGSWYIHRLQLDDLAHLPGVAVGVDPGLVRDGVLRRRGAWWCPQVQTAGLEHGTPGDPNDPCTWPGTGRSVDTLVRGDLVITEVLFRSDDCGGEGIYLEVFNRTGDVLDLQGLRMVHRERSTFDEQHHVPLVAPGGYAALSLDRAYEACPHEVPFPVQSLARIGADRRVTLETPQGVVLDDLDLSRFQPLRGTPWQLSDDVDLTGDHVNDNVDDWCTGGQQIPGSTDFGSPGAPSACTVARPEPDTDPPPPPEDTAPDTPLDDTEQPDVDTDAVDPPDDEAPPGCACQSGRSPSGALPLLALLAWRRRRLNARCRPSRR